MKNMPQKPNPQQSVKIARHVTWVGFWWNAALGTAKVIAGVFGRSSALIADGIHSFSDFISDIIVLVMVGIARKKPDKKHEYGHGKYETLATILLAVVLLVVAIGILYGGVRQIIGFIHGEEIPRPDGVALIICAGSIIIKEWLYRYTRNAGIRIKSEAVVANAWHHRSDAFSSIATLAGVGGAMFLGGWGRICDPIAAIVVAIFIGIVSCRMASPAISELLEIALPESEQEEITKAITSTPGVMTFHRLRTRRSGANVIIDLHIKVDPDIKVEEGHLIATAVEDNIKSRFGKYSTFTNIHIEPYHGETILPDGSCK
ncbi:MAG: cation diffusion facilitator family transporter [Duncaniella sp.]|nr:cation diffusion facilitator family transporter [Duncaniella sp.]